LIIWCPEKCSHLRLFLFREALELSQLSRQNWYAQNLGGTDSWRLRRSPPFPSARVWRPELDSNQHRRLRRPSTGSVGRGKLERANGVEPSRASLATMPRTMRARVIGSCRRICTCYLRLIRSVLICMSFAAIDWWQVAGFERAISCARRRALQSRLSHTPKLVRAAGLALAPA
jgi:hypothetical protein